MAAKAKKLTAVQEKVWTRIILAAQTERDLYVQKIDKDMIVWSGSGIQQSTLKALDKYGLIKLIAPGAWRFTVTQLIPGYNTPAIGQDAPKAADGEIAALRAENEALRAALEDIRYRAVEALGEWSPVGFTHIPEDLEPYWFIRKAVDRALNAEPEQA